jgi:hypothetical protein
VLIAGEQRGRTRRQLPATEALDRALGEMACRLTLEEVYRLTRLTSPPLALVREAEPNGREMVLGREVSIAFPNKISHTSIRKLSHFIIDHRRTFGKSSGP